MGLDRADFAMTNYFARIDAVHTRHSAERLFAWGHAPRPLALAPNSAILPDACLPKPSPHQSAR